MDSTPRQLIEELQERDPHLAFPHHAVTDSWTREEIQTFFDTGGLIAPGSYASQPRPLPASNGNKTAVPTPPNFSLDH